MSEYLVFRLYGPMCSWGEIAVGESRHSSDHPSRSALLGLFAAALGISRGEEQAQSALAASWRFGVKLLSPGTLLRDYHTVIAPRRQKGIHHRTRRSEVLATETSTLLSSREYRVDSISIVAAEPVPGAHQASVSEQIEQMQNAFRRPQFCLYLGRKSCPLGLPLVPRVVAAASLRDALDQPWPPVAELAWVHKPTHTSWPSKTDRVRFGMGGARYFWEDGMSLNGTEDLPTAARPNLLELVRHDQPTSRRRWQFSPRREWSWFDPAESRSRLGEPESVGRDAKDATA